MFLFARVLSVQSKMASKQQALRERVVQFYETHGHRGKKFTVDHFRDENVLVSTVYRILASLSVVRKAGSCRPAKIMTKKKKKKVLKKLFDNKDGTSLRDAGRKYHCSHTLIHRTLKMESEEDSVSRVHGRADSDREIAVPVDDEQLPRDIVRAGRRKLLSTLQDPHSRK